MPKLIWMTLVFIGMLVVNALATTGVLNHQTTSEISNSQNVLFTPAGYVFAIWGIIYFLLAVWLYLQFKNKDKKEIKSEIADLFIVSCLFNILWLVSWHYELFAVSLVVMVLLLLTLILLYKQYAVKDNRFAGRLPFSVYLGWISVATITNAAFTLKYFDVSLGISEVTGTIVLIIIAGLLAIAGRYYSKDTYFALVFVWAIIGIGVKNSAPSLVTTAYVVAAIILLAIVVFPIISNHKQLKNN